MDPPNTQNNNIVTQTFDHPTVPDNTTEPTVQEQPNNASPPPTIDTTAELVHRLAMLEERLLSLQHENMLKEQESLRRCCRLADLTQIFDVSEPQRARLDSDLSPESPFTRLSRAVFGTLLATRLDSNYSLDTVKESFVSVCEAPSLIFAGNWRAAQHIAKAEARQETHYLSVLADHHFFVTPILVKRIAGGGKIYAKPLGLVMSLDEFSRDWGLFHFAPASSKSELDRLSHQQGI